MTAPTYPSSKPTTWPARTQDRDTFNAAAAATFDHYDDLPEFYNSLATYINQAVAALVASNLPSLTGEGGKAVFVNDGGTAVQLAKTLTYDTATAAPATGFGDYTANTWATALTDTVVAPSDTVYICFATLKFRPTGANSQFRARITVDGTAVAPNHITGFPSSQENVAVFGTRLIAAGTYDIDVDAQTNTDIVLDNVNLMALGFRF